MPRSATIIGAGPAGAVAAVALLQRGWAVTLIEQHRFPRDKVCGECLSALGIDVLNRLGLSAEVAKLAPVALDQAILHASHGGQATIPLPRRMWGLSRAALDTALLKAALAHGAHLLQLARCERIEPIDPPMHRALPPAGFPSHRLILRDLATNRVQSLESSLTLLADGKGALLPARHKATGDLGIKAHFTHVSGPRDAIELFALPGHYGGLAAIEPQHPHDPPRWNAAFSVPAHRVKVFHGDLEALFAAMIAQNPALQRRLRGAQRLGPILAAPLPRFGVAQRWPDNIVPIGNAAAALEPIGGEGMGLALRSAELAATACAEAEGSAPPPHHLPAALRRLWLARRLTCRLAGRVMSIPLLAEAAVLLATHNEHATRQALHWMGKNSAERAK
jgi:flavin-dependent dehydrogenase